MTERMWNALSCRNSANLPRKFMTDVERIDSGGQCFVQLFLSIDKMQCWASRKYIKWPDVEIISHVVAKIPRPKADPKWQKCHYSFPREALITNRLHAYSSTHKPLSTPTSALTTLALSPSWNGWTEPSNNGSDYILSIHRTPTNTLVIDSSAA